MVSERMGLLDDAIREHLELKRLKGADPNEVAREERDALGQRQDVSGQEVSGQDAIEQSLPAGAVEPDAAEAYEVEPYAGESEAGEPEVEPDEAMSPGRLTGPGQETVEIDMGSVLEDDRQDAGQAPDGRDEPGGGSHDAPRQADAQDSLEWEMPGEEPSARQDREDGDDAGEPVEDVLEETPDFLRETPEQDRLWFEQRPPRDFDFNE